MSDTPLDELRRQLAIAKGRAGQLRGDLANVERRVRELDAEIALREAGLTVGSRVEYLLSKPAFGYLAGVTVDWVRKWHIHPEKKDGTPAKTLLTTWKTPTPAPKVAE